jgi:hypothetical protein
MTDHRRVQAMAKELREECGRAETGEQGCFGRFRTFKALVMAQAKAVEYALYALFEESGDKAHAELRRYVLQGYEEHDLIDLLLKEMGQAEELTDQFRAKLRVLSDLLDHHIQQEERDFLPRVAQRLSHQELKDLCVVYTRERDQIFAKKSGIKRPALVSDPRNFTTH